MRLKIFHHPYLSPQPLSIVFACAGASTFKLEPKCISSVSVYKLKHRDSRYYLENGKLYSLEETLGLVAFYIPTFFFAASQIAFCRCRRFLQPCTFIPLCGFASFYRKLWLQAQCAALQLFIVICCRSSFSGSAAFYCDMWLQAHFPAVQLLFIKRRFPCFTAAFIIGACAGSRVFCAASMSPYFCNRCMRRFPRFLRCFDVTFFLLSAGSRVFLVLL